MKLLNLCLVISVWISPIAARFTTPQSPLRNEDFEIKVGSSLLDLNKHANSDHLASSFFEPMQNNATLIDFDDIELATPFAPITKYTPLSLGGFTLMNVPLAYQNGSLQPEDINCAASAPNALIGSRRHRSVWPRIGLSSGFSGQEADAKKAKSFRLIGLSVKPVGAVPALHRFIARGWVIEGGRAVDSAYLGITYLREGHQQPIRLDIYRFSFWQKNLSVVEMWGQSREGEDWEFCVDDVRVELVEE